MVLLFPLFLPLNSCKDNSGTLTPALLPKSDLISAYQTDTATVLTSMYLKDSTPTISVGDLLLGSYNDPVFGETKATIYAEAGASSYVALYPTLPPWATGNYTVDSALILLQLYPADYYGGGDAQTFEVFQNDTDVIIGSNHAYYSDTTIGHHRYPNPIGLQQVTPPNALAGHDTLRIKLNKSWCTNFAAQLAGSNGYWTSNNFNQLLHGVCITTSTPLQLPGQGSLLNIEPLASSFTAIYVYYHPNGYPIADSEHNVSFPLGGSASAYFVHFDHNYSTSYIGSFHPSGKRDSINGEQLMYVQATAGVNGRINFPNLYKNWSKLGSIIVNEATLTFPVQPNQYTNGSDYTSGPPSSLNLVATDSTGAQMELLNLGIPYNATLSTSNTYTFTITQYIQAVLNGQIVDRGLYLVPSDGAITANTVVLYGAQHGVSKANKTVLTIYYTPKKNP